MTRNRERPFATLDIYLASFLQLNNMKVTLELKDERVIFVFSASDELYHLMMQYNSNVNVPVADFVVAVKTLRGQMLTMREGRRSSY